MPRRDGTGPDGRGPKGGDRCRRAAPRLGDNPDRFEPWEVWDTLARAGICLTAYLVSRLTTRPPSRPGKVIDVTPKRSPKE